MRSPEVASLDSVGAQTERARTFFYFFTGRSFQGKIRELNEVAKLDHSFLVW